MPLGSGAAADTQFIVFDSSLVGVRPLAASDPMYVNYRAQFERAFALGERRPQTFFMNHHPILAFAPNPNSPMRRSQAMVLCNWAGYVDVSSRAARK